MSARSCVVILSYQGKTYRIKWPGMTEENRFQWESGNYSCDCNRSLFIARYCDPNFPEMDCGDAITLVDIQDK